MPRSRLARRIDSARPEHIADLRVLLALLRVYRGMQLPHEEMDMAAVGRPYWPVVRRHPALLRERLSGYRPGSGYALRGKRLDRSESAQELAAWLESVPRGARLPLEPSTPLVFEAIGEALVGGSPGFEPLLDAVQADLERLVAGKRLPMDRNIDLLAQLLALSETEKRFFALCAAAEVSTLGAGYFGCAQGLSRMVQAACNAIDAPDEHRVRSMIRRGSRLLRCGLLDIDVVANRHDMEDVMRLSRQGMLLLTAKALAITDLAAVALKQLPPASCGALQWPHLGQRMQLLERLMSEAVRGHAKGVNVLLYGAPGTGKTEFAAGLVARSGAAGYSVLDVDADGDAASRSERLASLMLTQAFAPKGRSVVVLDEAEDIFQNEYNSPMARMFGKREDSKSWMNGLLEGNQCPVIWISNRIDQIDPAYLRRFTFCLEFPKTPRGVRQSIAQAHLAPVGCSLQTVHAIASEPSVSPAMLATAARFTQIARLPPSQADMGVSTVLREMAKAMGSRLASKLPERSTRFDTRYLNVMGPVTADAVMSGLGRLGRGRLLLTGAPGTGKTQLAAEIAQLLGREVVYRTASDINSKWFGESEGNVARMFEDCDAAGEVLFLDEADTLLGARDTAAHRAEVAVTAEFLRQVEAFEGVFICATNFGSRLDAALLRRFEFRLELLPLTAPQRVDLFREVALGAADADPNEPLQPDARAVARLSAMDKLTPGDFANVKRRLSSLGLDVDPHEWIDELQAEHDTKPGAAGKSIGFV